ncbi:hypothetical protein Daus18300_003718 [Diaporthe australafricana]|uniref:Uncharacterized protein n=1 Tax=Diaporthe australafricana TaxID=127596 RepID=A0ABR3XD10_9PEZI
MTKKNVDGALCAMVDPLDGIDEAIEADMHSPGYSRECGTTTAYSACIDSKVD